MVTVECSGLGPDRRCWGRGCRPHVVGGLVVARVEAEGRSSRRSCRPRRRSASGWRTGTRSRTCVATRRIGDLDLLEARGVDAAWVAGSPAGAAGPSRWTGTTPRRRRRGRCARPRRCRWATRCSRGWRSPGWCTRGSRTGVPSGSLAARGGGRFEDLARVDPVALVHLDGDLVPLLAVPGEADHVLGRGAEQLGQRRAVHARPAPRAAQTVAPKLGAADGQAQHRRGDAQRGDGSSPAVARSNAEMTVHLIPLLDRAGGAGAPVVVRRVMLRARRMRRATDTVRLSRPRQRPGSPGGFDGRSEQAAGGVRAVGSPRAAGRVHRRGVGPAGRATTSGSRCACSRCSAAGWPPCPSWT